MAIEHIASDEIIRSGDYREKAAICGQLWSSGVHHFWTRDGLLARQRQGSSICVNCLKTTIKSIVSKEKINV